MKRKYLAEFALHVYSSQASIFYPSDLEVMKFDANYHIYMVNLVPKIKINIKSLKQYKDHISLDFLIVTGEGTKLENLRFALDDLNHEELFISADKSGRTLKVKTFDGKSAMELRALAIYLQFTNNPIDVEVLYIGQSFGKNGNRNALDRLKSHSTLQKIMADVSFQEEERDIALTLWEFSPRLYTSFDGISKSYEKDEAEDIAHMSSVIGAEQRYNQIINITEAALIHYFKPEYNEKFKNNFPLVTHGGYKDYYDLDYNSVIVEIDQETINVKVYSKHRRYEWFPDIKYTLHPKNVRKSMFDIFS